MSEAAAAALDIQSHSLSSELLLGIPEAFDLSFVCSSVEDKSLEKGL